MDKQGVLTERQSVRQGRFFFPHILSTKYTHSVACIGMSLHAISDVCSPTLVIASYF